MFQVRTNMNFEFGVTRLNSMKDPVVYLQSYLFTHLFFHMCFVSSLLRISVLNASV